MSQNAAVSSETTTNDEFDLVNTIFKLWNDRWLIIAFTFIFATLSIIYALTLNNQYRSEALLQPAASNSGANNKLAQLASSFGGLASLAGINLGGGGGIKTGMVLEILKSRQFINNFIERRNLKVLLFAGNKMDDETGEILIDPSIYDEKTNTWVRDEENPEPTALESYRLFSEKLYVYHDKISNFITIGYTHRSPQVAREWVNYLIQDLNEYIKKQDLEEANLSIEYLRAELDKTEIADLRVVINELIKEQLNTIMLARVKTDYALKIIDPPVEPELAVSPKRKLIVIVATILGGLLSLLYIFIRNNIIHRVQDKQAVANS